jgi:para-nitrobenzyl esterase
VEGREERGLLIFRGIPFARPTGGEHRFRAPRPIGAFAGTVDASRFGQASPQGQASLGALRRWSAVPRAGAGEDCLNLNVWTPAADAGRRPVLVWVHGGGFGHGSGSFHLYSGDRLARKGDVVVVTFNYRLGVLGGLDLRSFPGGEASDSNLSLRDQIAALEWVASNIEAFGGDPANVTLFGQSAGAISAAALLASPRGAGLFQRAILQSGAGDHVHRPAQARRLATLLLEKLGLDPARGDVVEALRAMHWEALLTAQHQVRSQHGLPLGQLAWQPVVDDDLLSDLPRARFERGEAAEVPILIGTNLDEWKMFTATDAKRRRLDEDTLRGYLARTFAGADHALVAGPGVEAREAIVEKALALYRTGPDGGTRSPAELWAALQGDRVFRHPALRLADAHARRGAKTWCYRFEWKPPLAPNRVGACHALELAFVFGTLRSLGLRPLFGASSAALALSDRIQSAWLAFARSGDPNVEGAGAWPIYRPDTGRVALLGGSAPTDGAMDSALRGFWDELCPAQGPAEPAP